MRSDTGRRPMCRQPARCVQARASVPGLMEAGSEHRSEPGAPAATPSGDAVVLRPIGHVESPLTDRAAAPRQGDEGAPDAWLALRADVLAGLEGIDVGDVLLVLTWLDRARRDVLSVRPRD